MPKGLEGTICACKCMFLFFINNFYLFSELMNVLSACPILGQQSCIICLNLRLYVSGSKCWWLNMILHVSLWHQLKDDPSLHLPLQVHSKRALDIMHKMNISLSSGWRLLFITSSVWQVLSMLCFHIHDIYRQLSWLSIVLLENVKYEFSADKIHTLLPI